MTPAGFPHSEILGSQLGYQLPKAYRRFPRPSSAPRAKASTVCPYKLNPPTNNNNKTKMLASTMQFSTHKQQPHPTDHTHPHQPTAHNTRQAREAVYGQAQPTTTKTPTPTPNPPTNRRSRDRDSWSLRTQQRVNRTSTTNSPPLPPPHHPHPEDEPLRQETVRRYSRPAKPAPRPRTWCSTHEQPPPAPTQREGPTGGLCTPHPPPQQAGAQGVQACRRSLERR